LKYDTHKSEFATDLCDSLQKLAAIGPKLVLMSVEGGIREANHILCTSLPKINLGIPNLCPPCDIPETECPPHCVCEIGWKACRGQRLQATIQVKNTAKVARPFNFTATPFQGPGNPNKAVELAPPNALLQPRQSVTVTVTFTVAPEFQAGQFYYAEVLITGAYEQCVRLLMHIYPEVTPHCVVEQGAIPTRIRAHRWYDHFQCEELCEEPRYVQTGPAGVGNPIDVHN